MAGIMAELPAYSSNDRPTQYQASQLMHFTESENISTQSQSSKFMNTELQNTQSESTQTQSTQSVRFQTQATQSDLLKTQSHQVQCDDLMSAKNLCSTYTQTETHAQTLSCNNTDLCCESEHLSTLNHLIYLPVSINDTQTQLLLDSGSCSSCISVKLFNQLGLNESEIEISDTCIKNMESSQVEVIGKYNLQFETENVTVTHPFLVVTLPDCIGVLGTDFNEKYNGYIKPAQQIYKCQLGKFKVQKILLNFLEYDHMKFLPQKVDRLDAITQPSLTKIHLPRLT